MFNTKILVIFVFFLALFAASFVIENETWSFTENRVYESVSSGEKEISAYFFYGQGCPHCDRVEPFIDQVEYEQPVKIYKYEIYQHRENLALLNDYFDKRAVPSEERGVPALFVSDSYFVGDEPVLNEFQQVISELLKEDARVVQASDFKAEGADDLVDANVCDESASNSGCLSIFTITVAALVDSVSPCSLAVLLFLVGVRPLVSDRRKRALKVGLAFSLSVFVTYTLFGLGLLSVIGITGLSSAFGVIAGVVAILVGIFYIKDYFWRGGGGFVMEVPRSLRPLVNRLIKGVASPAGAFLMGFIIAGFELPCTGGPYLFILGQLANTATRLQTIPVLLYYNFLFTMPLLLISVFLYFGCFSLKRAKEWNASNKGILRLISGIIITALGILVVPTSQLTQLTGMLLNCCRAILPPVLLILSCYLLCSMSRGHQMKARRFAPAIPTIMLLVLSIFAYPQLVGDVRANTAENKYESYLDSDILVADVRSNTAGNKYDSDILVADASSSVWSGGTNSRDVYYAREGEQFSCFACTQQDVMLGSDKTTLSTLAKFDSKDLIERTIDYRVMLQSREFVPQIGVSQELLRVVAGVEDKHVVVQFVDIPSAEEIQTLGTQGIELLDYLPNYAYFASVPVEKFDYLASHPNVRSVVSIQLNDKISPYIRDYGIGSWARNEDGTVRLMVIFFDDVSRESAINVIETYGKVDDAPEKSSTFMVSIPESSIYKLAEEEAVQWIEMAPPENETALDQARGAVGADVVQAYPYYLDGTGVTVAMWDEGRVDPNHDDFSGRLVIGDGYTSTSIHSTHVAGIMAGDGTLSSGNMRGMAINSDIRSYEWPNTITELDTETTNAITNNAILSQNSWSYAVSALRGNCYLHGDYDSWSQRYDEIVNGVLGDEIVLVGSAGNEENDGDCGPYPWNQTNPPICTSKNSICVGAIYSDTLGHTCFSSRGPTDDGRLKPDIVAPGDEANDDPNPCLTNKMINSTEPNDSYGDHGGTSMSAPMVSGAIALLREQFNSLGYVEIKPHTFKAILAQSADDLGNPGPDYTYGHGNLDIHEAVDLVIENYPNNELIRTGTVVDDEIDYYEMSVPHGVSTLRVALAWDDIEGTPGAAKELVNDLDLYLESPTGAYYFAYRLDPANPGNNAFTGWNDLDNLEVVEVGDPEPGKWSVRVWGWIVTGTEEYTLVTPYEDINCGDYVYHDTELGHDLICPTGDGLRIGSSNVILDCQGQTLQGNHTGIGIRNTNNYVTIRNCAIIDFDYGIYMYDIADLNHLIDNSISSNDYRGIYLDDAWTNEIRDNLLHSNGAGGVALTNSRYNEISFNGFIDNYGNAVDIRNSNYTTISFNNITGTANFAMYFYQSESNDVLNNFIDNTGSWSIYLLISNDHEFRDNFVNHPITHGVFSSNSNGTIFNNNRVCGLGWDFYTPSSSYTADENTCDSAYQFVDSGQPDACDFKCSGCRRPEDDLYADRDLIFCPGTYNIQDPGNDGVIKAQADGITLTCNNTILDGVTDTGYGIYIADHSYVTVENCIIQNYDRGILISDQANYNNIIYNTITSNSFAGIHLLRAKYNSIEYNTISLSDFGIRLFDTNYTDVRNNQIESNSYGIYMLSGASYNLIENNVVCANSARDIYDDLTGLSNVGDLNYCDVTSGYTDSGQTSGCDYECSGCRKAEDDLVVTENTKLCPYAYNIEDTGYNGVIMIGANGVELDCQGAGIFGVSAGSGYGIRNVGYDDVTVANCKIYNYFIAIDFYGGADYGYILYNDVSYNAAGIRLWGSNDVDIIGNTANLNTQYGIILTQNSDFNTMMFNVAEGNDIAGISAYAGSDDNGVGFNHVAGNNYGIYIYNSDYNYVHNNIVEDNTDTGVYFTSAANNNELHHNRICGNFLDISDMDSNYGDDNFCGTTNNWNDDGTVGCTFSCLLGDIDVDGDVDMYDLGLFADAYGSHEGEPRYEPGADLDVDGDVDMYDLAVFADNYGKTSLETRATSHVKRFIDSVSNQ